MYEVLLDPAAEKDSIRINRVFIHVIMHQFRNPEEWQYRV